MFILKAVSDIPNVFQLFVRIVLMCVRLKSFVGGWKSAVLPLPNPGGPELWGGAGFRPGHFVPSIRSTLSSSGEARLLPGPMGAQAWQATPLGRVWISGSALGLGAWKG